MQHRKAVTDAEGKFKLENIHPGIWTASADIEGFEPLRQTIEVRPDSAKNDYTFVVKPISKGYIKLQNDKLRGRIRASKALVDVTTQVRESEHLIELASASLKKFATREFHKVSTMAERKMDDLRKVDSSTSVEFGLKGFAVRRRVKKSANAR